jgi:hypothetical protein
VRDFIATFVGDLLACLLVLALLAIAGLVGCARESPLVVGPLPPRPPACIVVLGPPPSPPMSFRELATDCRHPDGTKMHPDDPCMNAGEVQELARALAQIHLYAVTAYRACSISLETDDETLRIIP